MNSDITFWKEKNLHLYTILQYEVICMNGTRAICSLIVLIILCKRKRCEPFLFLPPLLFFIKDFFDLIRSYFQLRIVEDP